jgi:hypothetical protein
MRKRWMVVAMGASLAAAVQAQGHGVHVNGNQCGYDSDYDVRLTAAGVDFARHDGRRPHDVFMHDGQLRVDGRPLAVSAEDAARLREYEDGTSKVLPQMAGIAQEAIGIAFDSLATVAATLGGSQHHRDALVARMNDERREALRQLDAHVNATHWDAQGFGTAIEQPVTDAANEMAESITGSVMWAVLTGRASEVEARADSIDASIDKAMDARSDKLEARAEAICPQLKSLEQLQRQFRFRLADGSALQLIRSDKERDNEARQVAAR